MLRYVGTVYRPPSEAGSLLVQATIGCPHNKCRFCGMYKNKRFKIRPVAETLQDLDEARKQYGSGARTLFFPDGNSIIIKTAGLLKILERARENFPHLERITMYGSARFLALKSVEELRSLKEAGLGRIHMGLESGDDETLDFMCKGATAEESILAGRKVKDAGLELSLYYLVGIGGRGRLEEHALGSAAAVNRIGPDFIRLRTYYAVPEAPLFKDIQEGRFELPSPLEALRELELFISNLDTRSMLLSDHVSNYLNLSGRLPEDQPELLTELREAINRGEPGSMRSLAYL